MAQHRRPFSRRLMRGLTASIRGNSNAYGYSIVATADFAVLSKLTSSSTLTDIFLFIAGAVLAFAMIEAIGTRMFTRSLPDEPSRVVALGSAIGIISISAAVGVAVGVGKLLPPLAAWPVGAFASSVIYLLVVAVEMALAEHVEREGEDD